MSSIHQIFFVLATVVRESLKKSLGGGSGTNNPYSARLLPCHLVTLFYPSQPLTQSSMVVHALHTLHFEFFLRR